jgi:hypothetical protein
MEPFDVAAVHVLQGAFDPDQVGEQVCEQGSVAHTPTPTQRVLESFERCQPQPDGLGQEADESLGAEPLPDIQHRVLGTDA